MSKAGALAARPTDKELEKGRVEQARVRRYWAGKAPEWAQEQLHELQITDKDAVVRTDVAAPVIVKKADPRLARLAASRAADVEEVRERHREIRAAEIVRRRRSGTEDEQTSSAGEEEQEEQHARRGRAPSGDGEGPTLRGQPGRVQEPQQEEEEEEELLRRRQAVRERLLQQQREAEAAQQAQQADEEEEEEESSEYETDSEDEAQGRRLLKPVFVPKQARDTIAEREQLEAEEEALREYDKKREQERKVETREILKATVEAEEAQARAAAEAVHTSTVADWREINTDDDEADVNAEFELWKARERARIQRDRGLRERLEAEAAERERLKNMTEEERRAWEAANPKQQVVKQKQKWRFLQKYWHKGAFFQEDADDVRGTVGKDDIFERDYSAPTGEDKVNKELLPKIMQVKNFGRSGRTKWTHLLSEDTTQIAAPLAQASADRKRYAGSSAEEFAKPKKFRT